MEKTMSWYKNNEEGEEYLFISGGTTITVMDVATDKRYHFPTKYPARLSPTGSLIAAREQGGVISVREVIHTSTQWTSSSPVFTSQDVIGPVRGIVWSPTSDLLAIQGIPGTTIIEASIRWRRRIGKVCCTYRPELVTSAPQPMAFSPSGNLLAIAEDGFIALCETSSGYLRREYSERMVTYLAWSPDSTLLAVGYTDGIELRQTSGLRILDTLTNRKVGLSTLSWSPDSTLLAVGYTDGRVLLWSQNPSSGFWMDRSARKSPMPHSIAALAWSPGGQQLAVLDEKENLEIVQAQEK